MAEIKNGYQPTAKLHTENLILPNCGSHVFEPEAQRKLATAKEIIKNLCGMVRELNKPNVQLTNVDYSLSEAEHFLGDLSGENYNAGII